MNRRPAPKLTDRDAARLVLATDLGFSTIRRAYAGDAVRPDRLHAIELAAVENNIAPPPAALVNQVYKRPSALGTGGSLCPTPKQKRPNPWPGRSSETP